LLLFCCTASDPVSEHALCGRRCRSRGHTLAGGLDYSRSADTLPLSSRVTTTDAHRWQAVSLRRTRRRPPCISVAAASTLGAADARDEYRALSFLRRLPFKLCSCSSSRNQAATDLSFARQVYESRRRRKSTRARSRSSPPPRRKTPSRATARPSRTSLSRSRPSRAPSSFVSIRASTRAFRRSASRSAISSTLRPTPALSRYVLTFSSCSSKAVAHDAVLSASASADPTPTRPSSISKPRSTCRYQRARCTRRRRSFRT
jgi:hypothetical protein